MVYKIFLKVYKLTGNSSLFSGIIPIDPPMTDMENYEFIDQLEGVIEEGYSFKPTTLDAFIKYKQEIEMGRTDGELIDLDSQNISC